MSENISITRISDLPSNNGNGVGIMENNFNNIYTNKIAEDSGSNVYMPLNPHPNPYGNQPTVELPPPPQQQYPYSQQQQQQMQQQNQMLPQIQKEMNPEYRLPQRDIPMNITDFTHDEQIQPNYIPKPKLTSDYIEKHEEATQYKIHEYEKKQKKENQMNELLDKIHTPIILAFLYFLFQLPIINTIIFKRFSFLSIYKEDGNFNLLGLIMKSSLFASVFFLIENSTQYIVKIFD